MKNLPLITIIITLFTFVSCKKDNHDPITVTFNVSEPAMNDTITQGAEIHFEGTIIGTGEMHGYEWSFVNAESGQILSSGAISDHTDSYMFHQHYENDFTDTTEVICRLVVSPGHNSEDVTKEITVICLP